MSCGSIGLARAEFDQVVRGMDNNG